MNTPDEMNAPDEHMRILEMIESGVITAAQGSELLLALQEEGDEEPTGFIPATPERLHTESVVSEAASSFSPPPPQPEPAPRARAATPSATRTPLETRFARWRNWWYFPLSAGIFVTVLSGWFLYLGTQNEWAGFWMACIWLPLLFGMFLTVLSWYSHSSLWVHVRVNTGQDEWPRRIAISLPLPLRLGAWFMRTFQHRIPGIPNMENVPLDEIITAVRKGVKPEEPIYVEVDNGPGQEKVEVYIG